jgi:uncharacterized membrane protein YdbT with pleckstrin-like domain
MAYLDRVLQPGETLLMRGRLHWFIYVNAMIGLLLGVVVATATSVFVANREIALMGYIVAAVLLIAALLHLLVRMIQVATTEFAVTNHRVIVKRGFLSLHTVEMNVDKVESVDVDQSLMGRMLGYGEVTIHGVGARWDPIAGIADPLGFRNAITTQAPQASS